MISMQDKLLGMIEKSMTDGDDTIEVVQRPQFSHAGWLYAQIGLHTLLELRYSLQNTYIILDLSGPAVAHLGNGNWQRSNQLDGPHAHWFDLKYNDGRRLTEMLLLIHAAVKATRDAESNDTDTDEI